MARIPYPTREDIPETYRPAFDRMLRERGNPAPNVFLALANLPHALDSLLSFTRDMRQGAAIAPRYRELAIMMVGHCTNSAYEFDHHWKAALRAGLQREQLKNLAEYETSPRFDDRERAILRYAEEVTATTGARDETWQALLRHFPENEIMDLVMAVAWYNAVARILTPLEIELEEWFSRD
ncbi:carboxymuconolactone decarboxylase family protein [Sinorhizobium fredii]|uniref:carboxymuconolactone decarboxylase family protein n=1 Tax=Rhizobium fredii TaxID=380 RepID=UPI0030964FA0